MMPTARPFVDHEEVAAVAETLASGWLGLGPKTREFEQRLSELIGCDHVVATNSGTAALHLALEAFSVGKGDEVIVPSMTFCASVQAILAVDATPVFADVDPSTLCVDPSDIARKITNRTKAIMPVHYGGQPCDLDDIMRIAEGSALVVVEDAAHAFGSYYKGTPIGVLGDATCFSFDPIKTITCGEGGAVTLRDAGAAERIRAMRTLGMTRDSYDRYRKGGVGYQVTTAGYRYHMSDINAAIGLKQLDKYRDIVARRRKIWKRYHVAFSNTPGLSLLEHDLSQIVPFHFVVKVLDGRRDALMAYLQDAGVGSGIHYPPNHLQPLFREAASPLPITEEVADQILTLPLYPAMTDGEVRHVVRIMKAGLQEAQPAG